MNEVSALARESARFGTIIGIATILLGIVAIMAPLFAGGFVAVLVAILIIASGIGQTIFAFKSETFGRGLARFLVGGLLVLCGVVMLARPMLGLASLTMIVGCYFIVDGITRIALAFQIKPMKGWGWVLFDGIVALVLAFLILREWPLSGEWAVGTLLGAHLLIRGWTLIMVGATGEAVSEEIDAATAP